jgi:hypothetical protein
LIIIEYRSIAAGTTVFIANVKLLMDAAAIRRKVPEFEGSSVSRRTKAYYGGY